MREVCFGVSSMNFEACESQSPEGTSLGLACVRCLTPAVHELREQREDLAKQNEFLTKQVDIDTLTKVFGRNAFERMVEERIGLGEPFALLFADIRNFGEANRREGHALGDTLLVNTAQFLTQRVREEDGVIYRWGGDEFCILLGHAKDDQGQRVSELSIEQQAEAVKHRLTEDYRNSFAIWAYNDFHRHIDALDLNIDYSVWQPGMVASELISKADPKHNP